MKLGSLTEHRGKAETPIIESYTPVQATNIAGDGFQRSLPFDDQAHWPTSCR